MEPGATRRVGSTLAAVVVGLLLGMVLATVVVRRLPEPACDDTRPGRAAACAARSTTARDLAVGGAAGAVLAVAALAVIRRARRDRR